MRKVKFEHGVIYNGDCLDVMPEVIADNSIDMILADLPYNTTAAHWDCLIPLEMLWPGYKRTLKEKGVSALTGTVRPKLWFVRYTRQPVNRQILIK